MRAAWWAVGLLLVAAPVDRALADDEGARAALDLLARKCEKCHKAGVDGAGFRVLDRAVLRADPPADNDRDKYLVPGDPEASLLWQRVEDDSMPDKGPPLTDGEKKILKDWIAAGGEFPAARSAPFERLDAVGALRAVAADLRTIPDPIKRKGRRYFLLTPDHNNADLPDRERATRQLRAALGKVINSLSWKPSIVVPEVVDAPRGAVLAINLRDLGWDQSTWEQIVSRYPYGTKPNTDEKANRALFEKIAEVTGTPLFALRADWFVVKAMQTPLYETILRLPGTAKGLEDLLEVDVMRDFRDGKLSRVGLAKSGVSAQNRLVDRHKAKYGSYWKSYDFDKDIDRGSLARFPLGPSFDGHPFPQQAFEHAGGEMIFTLPNGMQGYYLTDEKGKPLPKGPTNVVRDSGEILGTPEIVNGISCMGCHVQGILHLSDTLRADLAITGPARQRAMKLIPSRGQLDQLIAAEQARFLQANRKASGGAIPREDTTDPFRAVVTRYRERLDLNRAAIELGLTEPVKLREVIRAKPRLTTRHGLQTLVNEGGSIARELWERHDVTSAFQAATQELGLGVPNSAAPP